MNISWALIVPVILTIIGSLVFGGLRLPNPPFGFLKCTLIIATLLISAKIVWDAVNADSLFGRFILPVLVGSIALLSLSESIRWIKSHEPATRLVNEKETASIAEQQTRTADQKAQGGKGGSGEIFGNYGTIIGGNGGDVGSGAVGRGGDGGGGFIHGDGGTIIGGDGGSVDGTNIWFPPVQSGYIQSLESRGLTPDFNVQYPGAGGATAEWLQRQQVVVKIREEYFKKTGQEAKIQSSKIEDVPLEYINEKLKESGYPWRARTEKKYWYLYFVTSTH